MNKIAFCFLLYDQVKHAKQWEEFFSFENTYTIYSHLKTVTDNTQEWIEKSKIRTIKTGWCEKSLVYAWINLLIEALKDPENEYFVLLSGECIPLFTYEETYKKITKSKKSRIHVDPDWEGTNETGLTYADQWVTLNRKHANLLVKLKTTDKGREYAKQMYKKCRVEDGNNVWTYCPDELFPVNWFIHYYGKWYSPSFKKEFLNLPTTFTYWEDGTSPVKFNNKRMEKMKKKICQSKAIFGRKFNKEATKNLAMTCGDL